MSRKSHRKLKVMGVLFLFGLLFSPALAENVDTVWVRRYNGPGNGDDFASKLVLDLQGNAYVVGSSTGDGSGLDMVVLKYDPEGNLLWEKRYNGPGNGNDAIRDIKLDSSGNVLVCGISAGIQSDGDYAVVKYDTSGNELWNARFDRFSYCDSAGCLKGAGPDTAFALDFDSAGNIYITGQSFTSEPFQSDWVTVSFDEQGNRRWVHIFGLEWGLGVAVGRSGVYSIGGRSVNHFVLKNSFDGSVLWSKTLHDAIAPAHSLIFDLAGDFYSVGEGPGFGNSSYATTKYDPNGKAIWTRLYGGLGFFGRNLITDMTLEVNGDVTVTGKSFGAFSDSVLNDYATIKYDSIGNQKWVARYNGLAGKNDEATGVAADELGGIYVTGKSWEDGKHFDWATIKYDSSGNQVWVYRYNGALDSTDLATDIAVDSSGNAYVVGHSYNGESGFDIVTIKYVSFLRGDLSGDKLLNLTDVVLQLNCVFLGEGDCPAQIADLNCDGLLTGSDVVHLLNLVYLFYPAPC